MNLFQQNEATEPLYGTHKLLFIVQHIGCFWPRWLARAEKHTLHTLLPGAMQSGTFCTPECPFSCDDGFVGQGKKNTVVV